MFLWDRNGLPLFTFRCHLPINGLSVLARFIIILDWCDERHNPLYRNANQPNWRCKMQGLVVVANWLAIMYSCNWIRRLWLWIKGRRIFKGGVFFAKAMVDFFFDLPLFVRRACLTWDGELYSEPIRVGFESCEIRMHCICDRSSTFRTIEDKPRSLREEESSFDLSRKVKAPSLKNNQ